MAASMSWTLKVEFEGDVRRLRNWPEQGCEPSLASLRSAIGVLLGFSHSDAEPLSIKYRDDEGDLCTLNEATLPDALALAAGPPRLLRLVLARLPSGDVSADATPTRGVAELEVAPLPAVPPSTPAFTCVAEAPADAAAVAVVSGSASEGEAAAATADVASGAAGEAEAVAEAAGAAGRAEVRRQLGEGLAHFGRQVASDFCSARKDAKDAFRPKGNLAGREEHACLVDKVSAVPAVVIGAVVAARLAPVRLTKLAAHSVATVAGKSTSMEDWEPLDTANASSTEDPSAGEAHDSTAGGSGDLKEEFKHFTQQVTQDFKVAKADVQAAFGYVIGGPRPSAEHPSAEEEPSPPQPQQAQQSAPRQEEQEPQQERPPQSEAQQHWTARSAVPALASTVAGVTVAGTLVPVRALRLAVASAAAVASARAAGRQETTGAAGAVRTEEGPAEPLQADPEADEVDTGAATQVAEDEALARRLQAEDSDAATASAHAAVPTTPAATSQP